MPTNLTPAAPIDLFGQFLARFTPQAWVRDYAVDVDPDGPQEWDATAFVQANADYFARLAQRDRTGSLDDPGGILDNDDVLQRDPAAPEWVRRWQGPFTIFVSRVAQQR